MSLFALLLGCLWAVLSVTILGYVAIATPIGPWIAPTLALGTLLIMRGMRQRITVSTVGLSVATGSIGGIIATAFGFSFPALFFLNPPEFIEWVNKPLVFCVMVSLLAIIGALWGIWCADIFEEMLIEKQQLPFPVGQLTARLISTYDSMVEQIQLGVGIALTSTLVILQNIPRTLFRIPSQVMLLPSIHMGVFTIPSFIILIMPMLWAIGFIAGAAITIPLLVGALSRIFLLDPLHAWWWSHVSGVEYTLSFCSGMVVISTIHAMIAFGNTILATRKKMIGIHIPFILDIMRRSVKVCFTPRGLYTLVLLCITAGCAYMMRFNTMTICYVLISTIIWNYQLLSIAGKIGLALLGRFATFVMIPALLFTHDPIHLIIISTFVELSGGVAADLLFNRKMGRDLAINQRILYWYQVIGAMISCVAISGVLWILIKYIGLGTPALFAQKAQLRQLLLQVNRFDIFVVIVGMMFGQLISYIRINAMLVLGGILMPFSFSTGLILGGLLSMIIPAASYYEPFWSGVFATNALAIVIAALFNH